MPEIIQTKRRLPHVFIPGQPVFVTWRLSFSLPAPLIRELGELRRKYSEELDGISEEHQKLQSYLNHKRLFGWLDDQYGCLGSSDVNLAAPETAGILAHTLLSRQDKDYHLQTYCVMPNHVHALFSPAGEGQQAAASLSAILKQWKGSSARSINLACGRSGTLWAKESYDHFVRSEEERNRIIAYILDNPVKAGLVKDRKSWPYTWLDEDGGKYFADI